MTEGIPKYRPRALSPISGKKKELNIEGKRVPPPLRHIKDAVEKMTHSGVASVQAEIERQFTALESNISVLEEKAKELIHPEKITDEAAKAIREKIKELSHNPLIDEKQKSRLEDVLSSIDQAIETEIDYLLKSWQCDQGFTIDRLIEYLKVRNPDRDFEKLDNVKKGLCYGLTLLYCYYQFKNEELTFLKRLTRDISAEPRFFRKDLNEKRWDELTDEERNFEQLCNDLFYLQSTESIPFSGEMQSVKLLQFVSDAPEIRDLSIQLKTHIDFSIDDESKSFTDLQKFLTEILTRDTDKNKFLLFTATYPIGDHATGIFYKNNTFYAYDPNFREGRKSFPFDPKNPEASIKELVEVLFLDSPTGVLRDITHLGCQVISNTPLDELKENELFLKKAKDIREVWQKILDQGSSLGLTDPHLFEVKDGDISKQFSVWITSNKNALSSLTTLDLGGCFIRELPEEIGQLENLEELDISGNYLTPFPGFIINLKNLKTLMVENIDSEVEQKLEDRGVEVVWTLSILPPDYEPNYESDIE